MIAEDDDGFWFVSTGKDFVGVYVRVGTPGTPPQVISKAQAIALGATLVRLVEEDA